MQSKFQHLLEQIEKAQRTGKIDRIELSGSFLDDHEVARYITIPSVGFGSFLGIQIHVVPDVKILLKEAHG